MGQACGVGLLVVAGAAVLTVIFTWWLTPWDNINGRLANDAFDTYGLIPAAWSVAVSGIGVLAGTLARRVVPTMAITLGAYLAIRLPIEFRFRSSYLPPSPCGARRRITPCPPETCSWGSERWRRTATTS